MYYCNLFTIVEGFRIGVWFLINVHLVARFLNFDLETFLTGLLAFFVR